MKNKELMVKKLVAKEEFYANEIIFNAELSKRIDEVKENYENAPEGEAESEKLETAAWEFYLKNERNALLTLHYNVKKMVQFLKITLEKETTDERNETR